MTSLFEHLRLTFADIPDTDFLTPNLKFDVRQPLDVDAVDVISRFLSSQGKDYAPNPMHFDRLLAESISYVDRCISARSKARKIRDELFRSTLRYWEFVEKDTILQREIDAGLYEHELHSLQETRTGLLVSIKHLDAALQVAEGAEKHKLLAELSSAKATLKNVSAGIELEKQLIQTKSERRALAKKHEELIRSGTWDVNNLKGLHLRIEELKKSFDFDLGNAYCRLTACRRGVEKVFGDVASELLSGFPELDMNSVGLFESLRSWTRNMVSGIKMITARDQIHVQALSLNKDCLPGYDPLTGYDMMNLDEDETLDLKAAFRLLRGRGRTISVRVPEGKFESWTHRRLKDIALVAVHSGHHFSAELTPPPGVAACDPVKLTVNPIGTGLTMQGGSFSNVDPAGDWKLTIPARGSFDYHNPQRFDVEGEWPEFLETRTTDSDLILILRFVAIRKEGEGSP